MSCFPLVDELLVMVAKEREDACNIIEESLMARDACVDREALETLGNVIVVQADTPQCAVHGVPLRTGQECGACKGDTVSIVFC